MPAIDSPIETRRTSRAAGVRAATVRRLFSMKTKLLQLGRYVFGVGIGQRRDAKQTEASGKRGALTGAAWAANERSQASDDDARTEMFMLYESYSYVH
jgi:hypothetical protein